MTVETKCSLTEPKDRVTHTGSLSLPLLIIECTEQNDTRPSKCRKPSFLRCRNINDYSRDREQIFRSMFQMWPHSLCWVLLEDYSLFLLRKQTQKDTQLSQLRPKAQPAPELLRCHRPAPITTITEQFIFTLRHKSHRKILCSNILISKKSAGHSLRVKMLIYSSLVLRT